ncbi:beta-ketoacyl synthase N-terminal-like domain-containing protein [Streptosporangium sp. NPDC000396]|uniref:beta-ketoacyl synthase N-terminal-like domain-containing protein n=1 Tax=Streptosporangium sp. NPDC000396 TaxID=3366185 RepID=UPI003680EC8D
MVKDAVCVTGMAWTTALGTGLPEVWDRLLAGEHGLRDLPSEHRLRNTWAAVVDDPPHVMEPGSRLRALARETLARALADAKLTEEADAFAVIGTSFGAYLDDDTAALHRWAGEVAAATGLRRAPVVLSTACSSGSDAIAVGADLIRSGAAPICVCGGVDVLTPAKRLGHTALGTMSSTRLRPFDRRADGTLLGEGAGFVVLEAEESMRRRGVFSHAVLRGTGAANDAAGMTAPDPSGDSVVLAVERALAEGGLATADIAVINAHGSGTPANDAVETRSFTRLFPGAHRPAVFATKPAFGHSLGATGALEAIALALALRHGCVPPVSGLEHVAEGFPLPLPVGGPLRIGPGAGLSLTLGFGGFNTCLVLSRGDRGVG